MKRLLLVLAGMASLVLAGIALAADGGQRVTSGDPFATCTLGGDDFGGVVFPSTEPEVWLAANPADAQNLIGSIQQDRWSDGGAKGLVAPYSLDGGRSWSEVPLPFSECAAPYYHRKVLHYDRATDPWVDIGPDGTAYSITVSFNGNDNGNAVGVATSTDGGRSYGNLRSLLTEDPNDPTLPFNDKESITADPTVPGRAYAVWDRLQNIACPPGVPPASASSDDRVFVNRGGGPAAALDCFDGPALISLTRNGGRSWSTPRPIVAAVANEQTIANQIVVDPRTHTLYDFYMYFAADNSATVENVASHDGGLTWGPRQLVSDSRTVGVTDPQTGAPLRTGDIIPEPAIDPRTGRLYVVWQDPRYNTVDPNEDQLVVSTSTAGGLTGTWSVPALVNDPRDRAAFTPAVKVTSTGRLAVQYYALRRDDHRADQLPTDVMLRFSNGPGTRFSAPEQAIGGPFNMLAAPFAGGYFTGDYEGLALDLGNPGHVHPFVTMTNCRDSRCAAVRDFDADGNPIPSNAPNPTDVYTFGDRPEER
ncbi:MAG: hypothetical protein QOF43_54 [Gaiellaceae bacterium]|nr:hypothetical protein [Gaiellaceae bacterium]